MSSDRVMSKEITSEELSSDKPDRPAHYSGSKWYSSTAQSLSGQNRTLAKILIGQAFAIVLLVVVIIIMMLTTPKPQFFATTPDLRVVALSPLSEPFINDEAIVNFSSKVVSESMSLDFRRWKETLMRVKPDYSDAGFKSFTTALQASGTLESIQKLRLISVVALDGVPRITAQGVLSGSYAWKITVPIIIEYEGASGPTNKQVLDAEMLIMRADVRLKPKGVEVHQIFLKPRRY